MSEGPDSIIRHHTHGAHKTQDSRASSNMPLCHCDNRDGAAVCCARAIMARMHRNAAACAVVTERCIHLQMSTCCRTWRRGCLKSTIPHVHGSDDMQRSTSCGIVCHLLMRAHHAVIWTCLLPSPRNAQVMPGTDSTSSSDSKQARVSTCISSRTKTTGRHNTGSQRLQPSNPAQAAAPACAPKAPAAHEITSAAFSRPSPPGGCSTFWGGALHG